MNAGKKNPTRKCLYCGGEKFETGSIQTFGKPVFRPDKIKFMTLKVGLELAVEACLNCGNLQMNVDVSELIKITNETS